MSSKREVRVADSLTLKASKLRFAIYLFWSVLFLLLVIFVRFPQSAFFFVIRIIAAPWSLFGIVVSFSGLMTRRYDTVLSRDGIQFGSFYGKRHYRWADVNGIGVVPLATGKRVWIRLEQKSSDSSKDSLRYLPENYGMQAEELVGLVLDWQREFGRAK